MIEHCLNTVPLEACGVLLGSPADGSNAPSPVIRQAAAVTNRAVDPKKAFRFDEREWLALLYDSEQSGMELLGIYHSHPTSPPLPSFQDRSSAWSGLNSYWIISLAGGEPIVGVYRLVAAADCSRYDFIPTPYSIV